MNNRDPRSDRLNRVTDAIRHSRLPDAEVERITSRTWNTVVEEVVRPLSGCGDFRDLIPALLAGDLPPARTLLVEDHTRECVSCRRALMEARGDLARPAPLARESSRRWPRLLKLAATVLVAAGLGSAGVVTVRDLVADRDLTASVTSLGEPAMLVDGASATALADGTEIGSRQLVRTPKLNGAEITLADGSVVEVAPRSELDLTASRRGTTVRLRRGNIIVRAAEQHGGRLFVATDDCRVAVKGTVFAVDHGFKGSRISVIEGEVEVRRPGRTDLLEPGEQITTSERLWTVPIEQQIAWSPNSQRHAELLRELTTLRRDLVDAIEPRTPRRASRLLAGVPGDTVVYIALPNLTDGLSHARAILSDRLATSPVLAQWWAANVAANGLDREIDLVLDRLQLVGSTIGDEVVVAVPESGLGRPGVGPLVLAMLDDPADLRALVSDEIASSDSNPDGPAVELVDEPDDALDSPADLKLWIGEDVLVASPDASRLIAAAEQLGSADNGAFSETDLHARLVEAYERGVSWVVGADLSVVSRRAAQGTDLEHRGLTEIIGLTDATSAVFGYSRDERTRSVAGGLYFDGGRRGAAAWLAEPAPMGSLDFVSPRASLAAAGLTRDAEEIFDELLAAIVRLDPEAVVELEELQRVLGLDLRTDLAATLGGEVAFAIDGPILPIPSWKLIVEVYRPDTLRHAVEQLVAAVNQVLTEHRRPALEMVESDVDGRRFITIRQPGNQLEIAFAVIDGYLVMAPSMTLIQDAIRYRESDVTLPRSARFRELLPDDGYTGCSAVLWKDLADLMNSLPPQVTEQLGAGAEVILGQDSQPGLWCVYGGRDRILVNGSGGGLFNAVPLLGLLSAAHGAVPGTNPPQHPLSSTG